MNDLEIESPEADLTRRSVMAMGVNAGVKIAAIGAAIAIAKVMKPTPAAAANCFLKGTMIRTADGEREVERLKAGDLLPTAFGEPKPIQWIGHYSYKKSDPAKRWVKDALPVRIARSALAAGVPHADLIVTKAHALYIDGVLVPAGSLINGTTITLYDACELNELAFFHIKLDSHDVIFAQGAPCETLLAVSENASNFAEYLREFGMPISEEAPCAPVLAFNGGRSELKSRLRSAFAPVLDRRQKLDVIRDRLEQRGLALSRQPVRTSCV